MKVKPDSFIILTPGFPEDENDTSCLPLQQSFVRELKVQHPQLDIIILSLQYPYKQEIYKWHDVTVLSFGGRNKRGIPKLFLRQKLFTELSKLHRETSIRGLLSFWLGEGALVGSRFAERNKLIHRCWVLGQDAKKENKYAGLIRPKNDELLALSDFIGMELWKNHQLHSSKAYPGIKVDGTKMEKDIDILGVGSLIPLKQFDLVIKTTGSLVKEFPSIKVRIIGEGPERKKLEQMIKDLGLEKNIQLTGSLDHNEVIRLMNRSRILLHPSAYEGFGMVCLEAIAVGAEVISFVQPLKSLPEQWHSVKSHEEMINKTREILNADRTPLFSTPLTIRNCVANIMDSFTHAEVNA